jgi:hypothetical protein
MKTRNEDGDLATLSCHDTGLLLALAHCSGWSADRIKLKIKKVSGIEFKPEDIWSFHWRWVMDRGNGAMCREDIEAMLWVLKEYGITLSEVGKKPLHTTEQPVSHCLVDYPYPSCKLSIISPFLVVYRRFIHCGYSLTGIY